MIKTAVIGVGSMGRNHARVYTELADAELVGVADPNQDATSWVAGRYRVPTYSDYRVLLDQERPDAVTIAVPTAMHEEVATVAMEAGAHVLVEKPIAATIEEGQRLIEKARFLGRQLMVGHIVRFSPAIQALKQALDDGQVGRIFQIVCRRVGPFPSRIRDVGVVVDLASHDLDVMRFLVRNDPIRVYAETERLIHTAHEDLMLGLLRFPGGVSGCLEVNWLTPTKVRDVLVVGERGMLRADDLTQDLFFYENAQANGELWAPLRQIKGVSEGKMVRYAIKRYEPLKAELQAFVKAVTSGDPVPVSGEDGLAALRLALALVESGKTHRSVDIPSSEQQWA